ncbi:MAG: NADH-quinone oxidoreductase subunit NuoN [Actinomycetaceae bacterium]|nr:NADH-quinone oxidoreductase subunit NuoN [Actinomycetaceae bacterium]
MLEGTLTAPDVQWAALVPVMIVLGAAVIGVLVEAFAPAKVRRAIQILLSLVAVLASLVVVVWRWTTINTADGSISPNQGILPEYMEDTLTLAAQAILLVIAFLAILVIADRTEIGDGAFAAQPADRPGSSDEDISIAKAYQRTEIFPLTLFSLGGMMVFPAATSLIALFVALEVMSLPLYIMAATARRRRQLSQEAALKYFVLGAFASAFFLMGGALLYGVTGTLNLNEIARTAPQLAGVDWIIIVGILGVLIGLLFKVGAAPFHAWTPDVYQGSPTPITGYMAAAVKVAAFATLVRFYLTVAQPFQWDLAWIVGAIAALTMLVGTFAGLVQKDIKRLLAYSSIAHAGFVLIGILALQESTAGSVMFYLLGYGIATVGAFAIVALVRHSDTQGNVTGEATEIARWAGLGRKSPLLATAMMIFLLSFAGIPLTSGFIGKFVVFADGIAGGYVGLVILALACSAITAFYYFRLMVLMFFTEPDESTVAIKSEGYGVIAIILSAVTTIVLGIAAQPVLELLSNVVVLLP